MNNNDNKRELTYNEAKALLARNYSDQQQQNNGLQNNLSNTNVEFGEEFAKKNNSNNQQSANIKTAANKDNNVKKAGK
jgi:hypothetical protein